MDYSVARKELFAYIDTESILGLALILWLKNTQFFFLYFLLSPFFLVFFLCPPPFFLSSYYILWLFYHFLHPRVSQVLKVFSFLLFLPFLESSILSCKTACSLFRHHLHINAASGLAGQHLMRRQQYPQIFVFPHPYPLFDILSFILLQGSSEAFP